MSRVTEMISALRKCAEEHKDEVVYTGQIVTSSLCRDVADYLEADRWHYPSKEELPTEVGRYFCKIKSEYSGWNNDWYEVVGWTGKYWILNDDEQVIAWQYIIPPKEEA